MSRSASAAGRIPLLDAARHRCEHWKTMCFRVPGRAFALATFVDNLLATGPSPEAATGILEDCEQYLMRQWSLQFGADSREFLVCTGYGKPLAVDKRWARRDSMKCLGHYLDADGGIKTCFDNSIRAMWRAFFGNQSAGLLASSTAAKKRFLNSCISTIPGFRWARWPYQESYAAKLDSTQRRMVSVLFNIKPCNGESWDTYVARRHNTSQSIVGRSKWSRYWARSVRTWNDHVLRNHDPRTWSYSVLMWHDQKWLSKVRMACSGVGESRTNTRAVRAKVHRRWEDGLDIAVLVPDPVG